MYSLEIQYTNLKELTHPYILSLAPTQCQIRVDKRDPERLAGDGPRGHSHPH